MPHAYVIDRSRLGLLELWRLTRLKLPLWVLGRLTGTIPRYSEVLWVPSSFAEAEVADVSLLPHEAHAVVERFVTEALAEGYVEPLFQRIGLTDTDVVVALLRAADGRTAAALYVAVPKGARHPRLDVSMAVKAETTGGTRIDCGNRGPRMTPPPDRITRHLPGATLAELKRVVHGELERAHAHGGPRPIKDAAALREFVADQEAHAFAWGCQRGVNVVQPAPGEGGSAADSGLDPVEAAVLAQLERGRRERTNWLNTFMVAMLSLALFVAVGGLHWSWRFAAMLAGVVAVHELGHLVLMRAFGYRNLRMFFVPLLGAAVTGKAHGVAGWKRVLVFLAGPLPGIALAAGFVVADLVIDQPLLTEIALVSFLLNGINLLPFRPLDGGWVIDILLASRVPAVSVAFSAVGSLGLLALGAWAGSWVFVVLAGLMLLGLPIAWKLSRVTSQLAASGSPFRSDGDGIAPDEALAILRPLRESLQQPLPSAALAAHVTQIHQQLTARAPGLAATLLLLGLYGGGAVAALAGTGTAMLQRDGALQELADPESWSLNPTRVMTSVETDARGDDDAPTHVVVAHFGDEAEAAERRAAQLAALGDGERLTRFGSTLMVATNRSGVAAWTGRLRGAGADPWVDARFNANDALADFQCTAATRADAAAIADLANLVFSGDWPSLRPAWMPVDATLPPEQAGAARRGTRDAGVHAALDGIASTNENTVQLESLAFERPDLTLPLVAAWLERSGCTDLRYDMFSLE